MKKYIIEVQVDEKKVRESSVEPDGATVEDMIKDVVQGKLNRQKWFDDPGIEITDVRPARKPREIKIKPTPISDQPGVRKYRPGGFWRLQENDVNWDDDDK